MTWREAAVGAATASEDHERVDRATRDRLVDEFLELEPPPFVIALGKSGFATTLPAAVPVRIGKYLEGFASGLDVCVPGDQDAILTAWLEARRSGVARAIVHMRADPGRAVTLHLVDARPRYAVFLGLFIGNDAALALPTVATSQLRPSQCTIERSEFGIILAFDEAASQILGWSAAELVGKSSLDIVHPDDRANSIVTWLETLRRPDLQQRSLSRHRCRDGTYVWFESTHYNRLGAPEHKNILSQMIDVSERMEALEALRASEQFLRRLTEALPIGVVQIDAGRRIVYANERLGAIVGASTSEAIDDRFAAATAADRILLDVTLRALLATGVAADIEMTLDDPTGSRRCSVGLRALTAQSGTIAGAILCIADITEGVRLREELRDRATFDELTLCRNRAAIIETLEAALDRPEHVRGVAVIFIDLDHFKDVNDRLGHAAGDELLRRVGERLLRGVRAGDVVGRLGGDEFLVVCPEIATAEAALEIGRRIAATVAQQTLVGTESIVPSSSIGVAWSDRSIDADAFVARADKAMYAAKRLAAGPVLSIV